MDALTKFAGEMSAIVLATIWRGYVLSVLWAWFIVVTFAAPILSIPAAIGLVLTLRFATVVVPKKNKADEELSFGERMSISFISPLLVLGAGWVVKSFI